MYSRMSWEATSGLMPIGAQHGRGRLMRPKRASSANGSASDGLAWRQPAWLSSRHLESHFFKSVLSRDVASGVKRTRHQLAPAVPGQKIIDRALAGFVPDGPFVARFEIVDVQYFVGSGGLGKAEHQGFFLFQRHVLALASATWFRLERLDSAVVIGHVRPVHRAQRHAHCRGNQSLRHPALAQQHHLDALTLLGGYFPSQRCFQPPDLALGAFDHLFPSESDDLSESHLASRRQFTATFGTRYPKHFDSISYGSGMRSPEQRAPGLQLSSSFFGRWRRGCHQAKGKSGPDPTGISEPSS